jgi:hypothetical protein
MTGYAKFCRHDDGLTRHIHADNYFHGGSARPSRFVSFYLIVAETLSGSNLPFIVRIITDTQAMPIVFSNSEKALCSPLSKPPVYSPTDIERGHGGKQNKN